MRKPNRIEYLYLDFDSFFASVEQQAKPDLRNRPVGVIPFNANKHTVLIACSREAKKRGLKSIMPVEDAKKQCPDLILVPQSPDLYRRAHNALISEINSVIPIEAVKSIDEVVCRVDEGDASKPIELGHRIKKRIEHEIGPFITCSIGFAANRQLAKIALKFGKPDGLVSWFPEQMPDPLFTVPLNDIPGIGTRMYQRLLDSNITTTKELYNTAPKQMRKLWRSVTGERLWYALHGYAVKAAPSERNMFGHGRVLPPEARDIESAQDCSRLLLSKASRRMRKAHYYANKLSLWFTARRPFNRMIPDEHREYRWHDTVDLFYVHDEHACLTGLRLLWQKAHNHLSKSDAIIRLGVTLHELTPANSRQLDFFMPDDAIRQKHEKLTKCLDSLNKRYAKTVLSYGVWNPPKNGYAGGKISFTRIPSAEDFY